ncbi:MAG: sensor domain-containing diguanylate cyclase [Anaerolineales bacterium]|nr:sensor domain-containing diguanylate cyclase [Anaerolineales bacterium]
MKSTKQERAGTFLRAREIIERDPSIPIEEKEGVLKLIQVLIEVTEGMPSANQQDETVKSLTQEIVSKHSLLALVKQQADELDALKRLGVNIASSLDQQTVLDSVVAEAMRLVKNARAAHIFLFVNGKLEFGAALTDDGMRNKPLALPRPNGLTYETLKKGQQFIVEDMAGHPLYDDLSTPWKGSIIGIPLKFNNEIVGVMNLSRSTIGGFSRSEIRLLGLLADQAAVAISNAKLHKQVTEQANTDSITGLPNRRALDERLQEEVRYARRMKTQFAVVMMDLDGFKNVNDTYGHAIGDEILNSAFNYLAGKMRSDDFLARYGGDELTLIMRNSGADAAASVTNKIMELLAGYSFSVNNTDQYQIKLGVTAGIAIYPLHAANAGDLLRAADTALYQAKRRNRGSYVIASGMTGPLDAVSVPK